MDSPELVLPFQLDPVEVERRLDDMVDAIWSTLQSQFMVLPKGSGFLSYERFAEAYYTLHEATKGFSEWSFDTVWSAFQADPVVFVVIRTILGLQPPEWAYLTSQEGTQVKQDQARDIDRLVREPDRPLSDMKLNLVRSMLATAVGLLSQPAPQVSPELIHRLDKVDTREGLTSLQHVARLGVPHPVLLYERFLGRPFASHRDAVSELVGEIMEVAAEKAMIQAGIPYRKTRRAERIPGWEQAPDFIVPDEWHPVVVIEAKMAEDDGTARDKTARILRLRHMADSRASSGLKPFQVVACIDGRGFGQRRQDMKDILKATQGKVFTLALISYLVDYTELARFKTK